MLYSQVILARKGPLGKIWLAAHYDKKLNKEQIYTTDIKDSIKCVLEPSNSLALRVSGHLMLGIVKIYSRKVRYLVDDCKNAWWKMKLAFRTASVDLPDSQALGVGIDDLRFFGAVSADQDFPDLENTAFNFAPSTPLYLLGNGEMDGQEEDLWERRSAPSTPRLSDVEFARGHERDDSIMLSGSRDRNSFGSSNGISKMADISRISTSGMDEEIPVFGDDDDLLGTGEPSQAFDIANHYEASYTDDTGAVVESYDNAAEVSERRFSSRLSAATAASSSASNFAGEQEQPEAPVRSSSRLAKPNETVSEQPEGILKSNKSKKRPKKKVRVVVVDQQVELNARKIKEIMQNRSELLRRNPDEPLPRSSARLSNNVYSNRFSYGSAAAGSGSGGGLAPELEDLLNTSTHSSHKAFRPVSYKSLQSEYEDMYGEPEFARGEDDSIYHDGGTVVKGRGNDSYRDSYPSGGPDLANRHSYDDSFISGSPTPIKNKNVLSSSHEEIYYEPFYTDVNNESFDNNYNNDNNSYLNDGNSNGGIDVANKPRIADPIQVNTSEWNPRTKHVFEIIDDQLQRNESITFQSLSAGVSKRTAATCFLELLQLKTWDVIDATQDAPYQSIKITTAH